MGEGGGQVQGPQLLWYWRHTTHSIDLASIHALTATLANFRPFMRPYLLLQ